MTNLLQRIKDRGFLSDSTDENGLNELFTKNSNVPVYIGFDCTAPSLHVGSLIQIMILRHIQQNGQKPIVLMGGGTTKIGDPSGKDESRKMLTDQDIDNNMNSIKQVFSQFIEFEDSFDATSNKAFMVNNDDWLKNINYIDFLREYGSLFSVNKMLSRESVRLRLEKESHMSFLEFNYMILQAYDFVKLFDDYGCRVQVGGSDQWGNIVGGIDLQHKVQTKKNEPSEDNKLYAFTTPLISTASGEKMGKTAQGAVWLNADQCSPYDYWQFWRNSDDADVGRFLRLFTDIGLDEITKLETAEGAAINDAKITLANAATTLAHGSKAAIEAAATAKNVFEQGGIGGDLPTVDVPEAELAAGIPAFKLFQTAGLEESGGAVRRLIKGGGAKVNDTKITDAEQLIGSADINTDGVIKLSAGKKRHALVKAA